MKVLLTHGDFGSYELTPVNKRFAKKFERETGHESILIQSDWEHPSLAQSLGWNLRNRGDKLCDHRGTDGTVACPRCGKTASVFIDQATDYIERHCDQIFVGKLDDYFNIF